MKSSEKTFCVAFTGHRPEKISGYGSKPAEVEQTIRRAAAAEISSLAAEGAMEFLCGMAPGFDIWCGEEVLNLRRNGAIPPETRLTAVIPYRGFEHSFAEEAWRRRYTDLINGADSAVFLAEEYSAGCFNVRNDYLVERSELLVAYFEGYAGGTAYTVHRALSRGGKVINLFQKMLF